MTYLTINATKQASTYAVLVDGFERQWVTFLFHLPFAWLSKYAPFEYRSIGTDAIEPKPIAHYLKDQQFLSLQLFRCFIQTKGWIGTYPTASTKCKQCSWVYKPELILIKHDSDFGIRPELVTQLGLSITPRAKSSVIILTLLVLHQLGNQYTSEQNPVALFISFVGKLSARES